MKILDGKELAGYIKERQAHEVRRLVANGVQPKLAILRDNDGDVIRKYVGLKQKYGDDIGVVVEDFVVSTEELIGKIDGLNRDNTVGGIIVQLPILEKERTEEVVSTIAAEKDADNLSGKATVEPATAVAINWLLTGYGVELKGKKIAIVGRGRLVGAPLYRIWESMGCDVSVFHRGDDLTKLIEYDIIVSATGVAGLIKTEMVKTGAVVVDAGTASEGGVIRGDVAPEVLLRKDLAAITPEKGGVGPLTVCLLFENLLRNYRGD